MHTVDFFLLQEDGLPTVRNMDELVANPAGTTVTPANANGAGGASKVLPAESGIELTDQFGNGQGGADASIKQHNPRASMTTTPLLNVGPASIAPAPSNQAVPFAAPAGVPASDGAGYDHTRHLTGGFPLVGLASPHASPAGYGPVIPPTPTGQQQGTGPYATYDPSFGQYQYAPVPQQGDPQGRY